MSVTCWRSCLCRMRADSDGAAEVNCWRCVYLLLWDAKIEKQVDLSNANLRYTGVLPFLRRAFSFQWSPSVQSDCVRSVLETGLQSSQICFLLAL